MSRHGERRNMRQEVTESEHGAAYAMPSVGVVSFPSVIYSEPRYEQFCARCGWQEQRGILGHVIGCPTCGAGWDETPTPNRHDGAGATVSPSYRNEQAGSPLPDTEEEGNA